MEVLGWMFVAFYWGCGAVSVFLMRRTIAYQGKYDPLLGACTALSVFMGWFVYALSAIHSAEKSSYPEDRDGGQYDGSQAA